MAYVCLVSVVALACNGTGDANDTPGSTGSQTPAPRERTLAAMSPKLTRDLTPALARERFGPPDVETGSGLIIYKYALDGGDTLSLGFPGYAPISYAQRLGANGSREQLSLR